MIPEFIDATDADMLSNKEIKDIVYRAMPGGWKTNFVNSGKEIHEESLESIERYMSTQQTAEEKWEKKKNKKNQNQNNNNNNNNNNNQQHGSAQSGQKRP